MEEPPAEKTEEVEKTDEVEKTEVENTEEVAAADADPTEESKEETPEIEEKKVPVLKKPATKTTPPQLKRPAAAESAGKAKAKAKAKVAATSPKKGEGDKGKEVEAKAKAKAKVAATPKKGEGEVEEDPKPKALAKGSGKGVKKTTKQTKKEKDKKEKKKEEKDKDKNHKEKKSKAQALEECFQNKDDEESEKEENMKEDEEEEEDELEETRDRSKSARFFTMLSQGGLPEAVLSAWQGAGSRKKQTEIINGIFLKKGGKFVIDPDFVLPTHYQKDKSTERIDSAKDSQSGFGRLIFCRKHNLSPEDLDECVRSGEVRQFKSGDIWLYSAVNVTMESEVKKSTKESLLGAQKDLTEEAATAFTAVFDRMVPEVNLPNVPGLPASSSSRELSHGRSNQSLGSILLRVQYVGD